MLDSLVHALMTPVHEVDRAARFMGGLSHRDNMEMQAQYLARDLLKRGVPEHLAWPAAHQYVSQQNIHLVGQEPAALTALANALRTDAFHHR